ARRRLDRQLRAKEAELRQVEEQLAAARSTLAEERLRLRDRSDRVGRLRAVRDVISRDEWDRALDEERTSRAAVAAAAHKVAELEAAGARIRKEMGFVREDQRNRWMAELAERREKETTLRGRIARAAFYNARQRITAPVDGFVSRVTVHTPGGVVTPAEKVIQLVPAAAPLVVKARVRNRDIGFVAPGMRAGVKVDAYDFQKYGLIEGEVVRVGANSIEDKALGLVYEVVVRPERTWLRVEGRRR
ncbi:HlyD family efflux transporter periplasmic adaptor subunit, partial [Dissulfurirhabdus thermomarina]